MDDTTPTSQVPSRAQLTRLPVFAAVLAGLLLLAGILVFALGPREADTFGWFAYAPVGEATGAPGMHFLTTSQVTGWLLLAMAVCASALWAGFILGRRNR
ncbi:hypothetical protein [Arthrobacter sp. UCD-GKA]|uniref:hypothetical protein n=1 Tax=Arthrobacter sp. UCD-GKA TaxID=1913576 RepID=UPI0011141843|nr:hypothetical protein [Arthrobacter sp. UCD-GKA]